MTNNNAHDVSLVAAESERRRRLYEAALSSIPDFVYVFSLDHRVLYANDALITMWGRGQEGAIGKTFLEIGYEPWHAQMHDREIDEVRATRQPVRGEVPFTGTLGRRHYEYIFVPVFGADGEVEAVAGTTRDVTDRKQADERHEFQTRLADTLRSLSDPVEVQAEASRVLGERLGANRVLYFEIVGDEYVIARDYATGVQSLAARYPVASFGPTLLANLLQGRTVIESDATTEPNRSPDERAAFAAIQLRAHVDVPLVKDGKFVAGLAVHRIDKHEWTRHEIGIIEDTAERTWAAVERARVDEERERLVEQLRDQDRRKDEFLATLAHELRNPLAPIRNGLHVMKLSEASGPIEKSRAMMERQVTQLVRLVDDLLDVSRVTSGKLELRKSHVELAAVIDAAIETVDPVIKQAGHELSVVLPDEPILIDADPTRFAQIVSNLLNNAAKYTPRGGHVRIAAHREGDTAVLVIADDGIGIPRHMLGKVFDMFTQVDRSLEKSTGGLGVGLSLVKGLVELHGGTVEARSAGENLGSEFIIRVPLVSPAPVSTQLLAEKSNDARPLRILIADDNADAAESLRVLLELLGNEVVLAYDGEQAVSMAEQARPDVVLLDIGMPRLNGYEACQRIRQQPWATKIHVIAMTGWGQDEDKQRSLAAGFDLHLVKPVDPVDLEKLLLSLKRVPAVSPPR